MSSTVCVVGSINMDLVVSAPRFPRPGETILGEGFSMHPGGKGANQAVAACRMGAHTSLVGALGDDDWGSELRGVLASEGVNIEHVKTVEKTHSGVGVVTVLPDGENSIVVASGANRRVTADDVDSASSLIADADVLVLQAEIPEEANRRAIELARKANTKVLLNAAPAEGLSTDILREVDILVLNREEAYSLVGDVERQVAPTGLARRLASFGPERVVVTLGAEGALHFNGQEMESFDGFSVSCVDSTAAGDAFVGALAAVRAEGLRLKDAVRYACGAGGLATKQSGAIPSIPQRDAVESLIRKGGSAKNAG